MKQQAVRVETQTADAGVHDSGTAFLTTRRHHPDRAAQHRMRKRRAFLAAFAERGSVQAACLESGVGRRTVYHWLERDEAFAPQFDDARQTATDVLEAECRRRALEGVPAPVYYQGKMVGHAQKYSDLLLLALLNAYRPERFGRRQEHRDRKGATLSAVVHVTYDARMKPDDMP